MRVAAKPLPYGIPPNVAGNILRDLLRPQYVIVIAHLPEPLAMSFFKLIGRALFEGIDELYEIGGVRETFTKEMNMVGHDAIGMQRKIPLSGSFHEMTEQPFPPGPIREKSRALFGPNGYEIILATAVVFRGTSQAFFKKGYVKRLTLNGRHRKSAGLKRGAYITTRLGATCCGWGWPERSNARGGGA
jgi:hypothetical protein